MKIIAHRSGPVSYPQQTIRSAKQAKEFGADIIEIDTRFTLDGKIIISHDRDALLYGVDRKFEEMTYEEVRGFKRTDKNVDDSFDYPLCTLRDFLTAGLGDILIHIKETGREKLDALVAEIRANRYTDRITLGFIDADDARYCGEIAPEIKKLAFMPSVESAKEFADAGCDYIRLWEKWICPEAVESVRGLEKKIWIMAGHVPGRKVGITDRAALENIISQIPDVDGILLNDVRELVDMRKRGEIV